MKYAFTTHRFELGFTLDIQNDAKIIIERESTKHYRAYFCNV